MQKKRQARKISRRTLLKGSGIAAGTILVSGCQPGATFNLEADLEGEFDYIICGAGSAGCVLANRYELSETGNIASVLLPR